MKKLPIIFFLFVFAAITSDNSYAIYCCGNPSAGQNSKLCYNITGTSCVQKKCGPIGGSGTTVNITGKVDVNDDGKIDSTDSYSPDCFIPIVAPKEVRITNFGTLFSGVVAFLLLIAFILSFFFLILGGISWLTSGGDKAAVEAARNKIVAAIVGLIIVAATWALFQLVGGAIGFNILGGFEVPRLF